jgi:hypothetical protein
MMRRGTGLIPAASHSSSSVPVTAQGPDPGKREPSAPDKAVVEFVVPAEDPASGRH